MNQSKLLSDCGNLLVIDDTCANRYQVQIDEGEFLIVKAGAISGKPAMGFAHPNVSGYNTSIFNFKHYRHGGGKYWTQKAGKEFVFVIPKSAITMLPEKGWSYVPAMINGVKVKFNVSGGSFNGWTDFLGKEVSISVNHGIRDLKKIAEASLYKPELVNLKPLSPEDSRVWEQLVAAGNKELIEGLAKMLEQGNSPLICLKAGFVEKQGRLTGVNRRKKLVRSEYGTRYEYTGAVKSCLVNTSGSAVYRVKTNQIDWASTASMNGKVIGK